MTKTFYEKLEDVPAVNVEAYDAGEYDGFLIYHRTPLVWDVVKDGACITQRAGPKGCRQFIDEQRTI